MTQPPNVKPLVGSSVGPPGACMTPSMETWAPTIIFRMGHAPCLSLGRTTCFRSLSRHYALCHGGDCAGGCETELEGDGHGVGAESHRQPAYLDLIKRWIVPANEPETHRGVRSPGVPELSPPYGDLRDGPGPGGGGGRRAARARC